MPDVESDVITDSALSEIPPSAAILVAGPPMTGKYELMLRLLRLHADSIIVITTKNGFQRVRDDLERVTNGFEPARFGIVDCVSYHQTVEVDDSTGPVRFTDSPENLTRIGVKFTELFEEFHGAPETGQLGVGIHSISQLLMHSEVKQVYQFLQVLIGQIRNAGCFVVAVVDETGHDDEAFRTLQQHFDGLVKTRENDVGAREYRLRGVTSQTTPWAEF